MAQKIEVKFLDDIDGSDAIGTLEFTWDGVTVQVDLSQAHMEEYNGIFQYLKSIGRTVSKSKRAPYGSKKAQGSSDAGKIREWLRSAGHEVSDRGRIPDRLVKLYQERPQGSQDPEKASPKAAMDPGVGTKKPARARATKAKTPEFKEALAEVLKLETPVKTTRRRSTTTKKTTSTTK